MALSGKEYADLVASYILKNFGARGLKVYREVSMGKTIIGKNRQLDILVIHEQSSAVLAIECKYQDTLGTVDEKIPYAIQDMQAMGVPVCLTYAGKGFSSGILHMLAACPIASQCLPQPSLEPTRETRELDIALAMAFRFWDLVVANKKPFLLSAEPAALLAAEAEPSVGAAALALPLAAAAREVAPVAPSVSLDSAPPSLDAAAMEAPVRSKAKPARPKAKVAAPEVTRAAPEVTRAAPEVTRAAPEATPVTPEAKSAEPEAKSAEPEAKSAEPEAKAAEPEAKSAEPEAKAAAPKAKPARPKAKPAELVVAPAVVEVAAVKPLASKTDLAASLFNAGPLFARGREPS